MIPSRKFLSVSAGTIGALGAVTYFDEGSRRSLQFWIYITPIYAHYRIYQILNREMGIISDESAARAYVSLDRKYTDSVRDTTYKMRGFYLKQAQLMSTQDDFVPPPYMEWVKNTQDSVPSEFNSPADVRNYCRKVMREEQGLEFDEVFSNWDDNPLGIASIGQVHRATLRESGEVVAVKIQLPGIEKRFRSDIHTLKTFCRIAFPQHVTSFDEMERQFCSEFDYREEARNLNKIRNNVIPRWGKFVSIPEPKLKFCSKHMLVMECLEGVKLVDGIRNQYRRLAESRGMTLDQLESSQTAIISLLTIEEGIKQRKELENRVWIYDNFLTANPLRLLYNYSPLRLILGPVNYYKTELPIDLAGTLKLICDVHGYQIFHGGSFNGDCHPGNILLLSDGRIGLIDYGQVSDLFYLIK